MPDRCLSGISNGDIHRVPELQYRFNPIHTEQVLEQVVKLDSYIKALTLRNLRYASDSFNAFLSVTARYLADDGSTLTPSSFMFRISIRCAV